MKYVIVTPTCEPHFTYIEKYLSSYKKFVLDKNEITIVFTILRQEAKHFERISYKYSDII